MRSSIILLLTAYCLVITGCKKETLGKIEYGPLASIETVLADNTITAGDLTSVTCILKADEGFEVLDPDSYVLYIEPVSDLEIAGFNITGNIPGEYEIRCALERELPNVTITPDHLTVEPADAHRMEILVNPEKDFYSIGDNVSLEASVYDRYDNQLDELTEFIEWNIPSDGLREVSSSPGKIVISFTQDGEYIVFAYLGEPYNISTEERLLICDSTPPDIIILSPERGESLDDTYITVTGTVSDNLSGTAELTINGIDVDISTEGSFTTDLVPDHGLNHITVTATDIAGNSSSAFTSVYHSPAWRPLGEESFDSALPDGLGVHLNPSAIDSGQRECGRNADGHYVCEEYKDMATFLEVLLNNMDLSEAELGEAYNYGPIVFTEVNLESMVINIPAVPILLPDRHRIHGSFILRGHYNISILVTSFETGYVEMGYKANNIIGLEPIDGGLDVLAYIQPEEAGSAGLKIGLQVRFDVDMRLFFSIDDIYHEDNGVWNRDTGANVTDAACDEYGVMHWVDFALEFAGWNTNFEGYICNEHPLVHTTPNVSTDGAVKFERVRLAANLLLEANEEGDVDVELTRRPGVPLVNFLGEAVEMELEDEIIIDLSEVDVLDGFLVFDLGEYSIGNPLTLLEPVISGLMTEFQFIIAVLLESYILCDGPEDCIIDIAGLFSGIFNSIAKRNHSVSWPAVIPEERDMNLVLSQYFSILDFSPEGGRMAFDTTISSSRRLHHSISDPLGTLLRGDCTGDGALAAVPYNRHMAAGFDLNLANQALLAGWYNGGLSGTISPDSPDGAIESFSMVLHPLLPPVITACTGDKEQLELQLGAAKLDLTMVITGVPVRATVYSDLSLFIQPQNSSGKLDLHVLGQPRINEIELISSDVRLGSHEDQIKQLIAGEIMPELLTEFGETVLAGIPIPSINVGAEHLPGIGIDIDVEFPLTEALHEEGVIIIVSDP